METPRQIEISSINLLGELLTRYSCAPEAISGPKITNCAPYSHTRRVLKSWRKTDKRWSISLYHLLHLTSSLFKRQPRGSHRGTVTSVAPLLQNIALHVASGRKHTTDLFSFGPLRLKDWKVWKASNHQVASPSEYKDHTDGTDCFNWTCSWIKRNITLLRWLPPPECRIRTRHISNALALLAKLQASRR